MSYRLYARPVAPITDPAEPLFDWALLDAVGEIQARGENHARAQIEQTLGQNALDTVRLIGLIPGDEALFCHASIPAKQERFIRQALPFAVEEQLAQDIESMHLALGGREAEGFRVAAIDHSHMAFWSALFEGWAHVELEAIYPDAGLLPCQDTDWAICLDGAYALLASARGEWLRMQIDNLAMFSHTLALPPEEEVAAEVKVTVFAGADDLAKSQSLIATLKAPGRLAIREETLELTPLELLAHSHHHHLCEPVNLCQGSYNVNRAGNSAWRPWRPAIAIAGLWLILQLGLEAGLGVYHQNQADKFNEQAMASYRAAFPEDTRTHAGNLRRVLSGELRVATQSGATTDFLSLMKQTGQQYSQLPAKDTVEFTSINFSQSRGKLVVDLRADDYSALTALRAGLNDRGLDADIGSVVNEASGARGRLTISGG
ncbi:MAG: type II secretion system protein GspL [Oleiphilaceae bacterium]|nr:type II secretion system protein GspL [Oleiphilaceae bacterium]